MHYLKNWPEGLFIALVMIVPPTAAYFLAHDRIPFLFLTIAGMGLGLLAWFTVVFLTCWLLDYKRSKNRTHSDSTEEQAKQ